MGIKYSIHGTLFFLVLHFNAHATCLLRTHDNQKYQRELLSSRIVDNIDDNEYIKFIIKITVIQDDIHAMVPYMITVALPSTCMS